MDRRDVYLVALAPLPQQQWLLVGGLRLRAHGLMANADEGLEFLEQILTWFWLGPALAGGGRRRNQARQGHPVSPSTKLIRPLRGVGGGG